MRVLGVVIAEPTVEPPVRLPALVTVPLAGERGLIPGILQELADVGLVVDTGMLQTFFTFAYVIMNSMLGRQPAGEETRACRRSRQFNWKPYINPFRLRVPPSPEPPQQTVPASLNQLAWAESAVGTMCLVLLSKAQEQFMNGIRFGLAAMAISFLVIGCRSPKPARTGMRTQAKPNYSKPLRPGMVALEKITNPAELPYFGPGLHDKQFLLESIEFSQGYFRKPSSLRYFPYLDITHDRAQQSLEEFKILLMNSDKETQFHEQIVSHFDVYRSVGYNNQGTVFFTGYCEPIYQGRLTPTAEFRYPLYKLPADLVKDPEGKPLGRRTATGEIVPYYNRQKIESEDLLRGQELVYLKNKLEAFIVHVQGSARIKLSDGSEYRVGYAGKTDHPYTSIGKELVKDGKIRENEMSLSAIKQFFASHPEELDHYLYRNECFVFFTQTEGGPYGSIGVPVTPYRSIATDKSIFPRGCLSFMKTNVPTFKQGGILSYRKFESFALDQDTGGAIRSPGRADIFVGTGPEAEILAGRTQAEGQLYYIFVKDGKTSDAGTFDVTPVARNTQ